MNCKDNEDNDEDYAFLLEVTWRVPLVDIVPLGIGTSYSGGRGCGAAEGSL